LIIPSGLAVLLMRAFPREKLALVAVLTILPVGALFLSASRGGLIGFCMEFVLVILLTSLRRPDRSEVFAGIILLVLAGALVTWLGIGPVLDRFEQYRLMEVSEARRAEVMRDSFRIFLDHPLLGTGLGTLQEVFPRYETLYDGLVVNHSHNDYVEGLAETGVVGGLFGIMFLTALFWGAWEQLKIPTGAMDSAFHIGALAACCGMLIHSFVDFNLHIPSNALLFLLQATLATAAFPSNKPKTAEARRPVRVRRTVPQVQGAHTS
jgi:O-antigen ligase